ncbi:NPC intracellular cholesterol transporter 2-like [Pecten maximus]|uniref:NPC intracellular cholesterol transporter 2-like n=1 Tax=Pecten maximus TaxID=6579 RepID=UPI0014591948|nr:NPC intracellular cholesterol transporter 2-like [Pecten maximus]
MSLTVLTCTVIAVTLLAICTSEPIEFKTCAKAPKTIESVDLKPCSKQPCQFKHGMNVTVTVNFTAPTNSAQVTSEIYGIVMGIPVKFAMPNSNGCKDSGLQCPLTSSTKYSYVQFFAVIPTYPLISLDVQWDLKDENGNYMFCFVFPMMIVS